MGIVYPFNMTLTGWEWYSNLENSTVTVSSTVDTRDHDTVSMEHVVLLQAILFHIVCMRIEILTNY